MATKLSVNINKIALIRNSRGENMPNIIKVALDCESFGADGITIHPRPDQRHAKYDDIHSLKRVLNTELNIEGYPSEELLYHIRLAQPHQFTLVPDPPRVLTSNSGWKIKENEEMLKNIILEMKELGIRVSLFIDPDPIQATAAAEVGADRVELFTGPYAKKYSLGDKTIIDAYIRTATTALEHGLEINAGHDLNLDNLRFFKDSIPQLAEVSIGHALVCDALYFGLENTIKMYKNKILSRESE